MSRFNRYLLIGKGGLSFSFLSKLGKNDKEELLPKLEKSAAAGGVGGGKGGGCKLLLQLVLLILLNFSNLSNHSFNSMSFVDGDFSIYFFTFSFVNLLARTRLSKFLIVRFFPSNF